MQNGEGPPAKKKRYECSTCGKEFTRSDALKRHERTHNGGKPHECPHCDKTFLRKEDLTRHIKQVHERRGAERQYTCNTCGETFNNLAPFRAHQRSAHEPSNATGNKRKQDQTGKSVSEIKISLDLSLRKLYEQLSWLNEARMQMNHEQNKTSVKQYQ